jgi:hypothetical protein
MDFAWKDFVLSFLGFLVGIPASMIASLLLGQPLTIVSGFRAIRFFARLRQKIWHDEIYDADWAQTWKVFSTRFPRENPGPLKIYKFLHLIAAETEMTAASGTGYQIRFVGILDRNIITGKWMDPAPHGYYGTAQFIVSNLREGADGRWLGFSSNGTVKTDDWHWKRYER